MKMPDPDIQSIESALATLGQEDTSKLSIPALSRGVTSFCAEAALLQFVVTWARHSPSATVASFLGLDSTAGSFETLVQKQLGLPYVLAAWVFANQLRDSNDRVMKRREAKGFTAFLDAMDNFEFHSTHETVETRANLVCVQGSRREFIRPFYEQLNNAWRVRPEGDVRVVVQDILAQLAENWTAKYLREVAEPLSHLIRELVENSDWWARADHRGVEYEKGIRAITLRVRDVDDDSLLMFAGGNTHIQTYLLYNLVNHPRVRKDDEPGSRGVRRYLSFLELTMVDSGPGLALRWLASRPENKRSVDRLDDVSLEEEEDAVIECFKKWRTSSGNSLRGVGLFSVASLLQRRQGFLRLRTGRLAFLFGTQSAMSDIENQLKTRDLSGDYDRLADGTHVFLQDEKLVFFLRPWSTDKLSTVEGTAYSILLPV
ncbi:ATP-binding protein [Pararobbsia alpina]